MTHSHQEIITSCGSDSLLALYSLFWLLWQKTIAPPKCQKSMKNTFCLHLGSNSLLPQQSQKTIGPTGSVMLESNKYIAYLAQLESCIPCIVIICYPKKYFLAIFQHSSYSTILDIVIAPSSIPANSCEPELKALLCLIAIHYLTLSTQYYLNM